MPTKMKNGRRPAATFGQDLMRGEHKLGQTSREATIEQQSNGVLMAAASAHPRYYEQKTASEKALKRKLTNEEFERDHWTPPDDSPCSTGTSIFDPVLCELNYRWFVPSGGSVLDPFSGGSVRGITAEFLGLKYTGIDLSADQIKANQKQGRAILPPKQQPRWIQGDSRKVADLCAGETFDFVFSCPPYGNLEVYSDDPSDLSSMAHADFIAAYREIIAASVGLLKPNRFAAFVVGDFRDKQGFYRNFVSDTISAFQDAGAKLYNEAILVTSVGSLPIRAGRQFASGRKMGKTHQNLIVFFKGDPKQISKDFPKVEVAFPAVETDPTL